MWNVLTIVQTTLPSLRRNRFSFSGLQFREHALARRAIVLIGDVERTEIDELPLGIADHLLKGGVGGHVTVLGVAEHNPNRKFLEHSAPADLARARRLVRFLAIGQVEYEGGALIRHSLERRGTDQHRDAAAVFPEVLFLMRLGGSGRLQLRHTSVVSSAPLGRRQFPPSQSTRAEIVAAVSHDAEESFVRVYNPTIEMPDEDPHNVGVD